MAISVPGYDSPSWSLAQLSLWVCHRSKFAVEAAGSSPSPHPEVALRLMAKFDGNQSDLDQASKEILSAMAARGLRCMVVGPDGKRQKLPPHVVVGADLAFDYDQRVLRDRGSDEKWRDPRFPRDDVVRIWPPKSEISAEVLAELSPAQPATPAVDSDRSNLKSASPTTSARKKPERTASRRIKKILDELTKEGVDALNMSTQVIVQKIQEREKKRGLPSAGLGKSTIEHAFSSWKKDQLG